MVRSIFALILAWLAFVAVWIVLMGGLFVVGSQVAPDEFRWPQPGEPPRPPQGVPWLLATLAVDLVAAAVAGYVVVRVARRAAVGHAAAAACVMAIALAATIFSDIEAGLPAWLPVARTLLAPAVLLVTARWQAHRSEC